MGVISHVTSLTIYKVIIQLKCGEKRFNRFNARIISSKNDKKNDDIRLIVRTVIAKITSVKTIKSCHFRYKNTDLICKGYLTAT